MERKKTINVKVPVKYSQRKYIDAIGMALFSLLRGERPEPDEVETGRIVSVRIHLSPKGEELWEYLLPKYDNNKRRLAREALCLVYNSPKHCLNCKI